MSLIFADSFDHYTALLRKYDLVGDNAVNAVAGVARTGSQYLQIVSGSAGPRKVLPAHYAQLIGQVAFNMNAPGTGQNPTILQFQVDGVGWNIAIRANGDGTMSIWRGNPGDGGSVELFRTTVRPVIWATWNYMQCQATFSDTVGTVVLNVNGRVVANLSGIRTTAAIGSEFADTVQLFGAGGSDFSYLDDFAVIDPTVSPNAAAIAQAKIYATVPSANASPVQWTPLAGQNFQNVDTIPPNEATYNSSSTIGQTDLYSHPLPAGIDPAAAVAAIQHCLDLVVDSGARTVASDIAGTVGTGFALTTTYHIKSQPSDGPWTQASFPLSAGPQVTA